ncbi:MAG: DUF2851 family protein [Kiritimatiellae bacterium]|nr:DUF2851 family protein [Kiritimatiellia bacterium]
MDISAFPLAEDYERLLAPGTGGAGAFPSSSFTSACEPHAAYGFPWTERHLQCVWFDERYRPRQFPLPGGETVEVLAPGEWNLEAGPDFLNATLRINPGGRRLRGDIEVHVRPSDWDAHGHASDPAYAQVVAHVTWFATPHPRTLAANVLALPLGGQLASRPDFSLDDIDLKAYPHAILPETPPPCEVFLKDNPKRALSLLAAAGQYRIRLKAARLAQRLRATGDREQVFYEETMTALGYKYNQAPFRALAKQLPFQNIRALKPEEALARLLGCARLLPQPDAAPDEEGRRFLRDLWDIWWKNSCETLPPELEWRTSNLRPQNFPARRLAAAARLFTGTPSLLAALDAHDGEPGQRWHSLCLDSFAERCRWPFFNQRLAFSSAPDPRRENALLGTGRAAAMVTNILLPLTVAENRLAPHALDHIPPEDLSAPMRLTALHLFGRDHNPSLYASDGLYLQGLLQIYLDFCLNAKPGCEDCGLRNALSKNET